MITLEVGSFKGGIEEGVQTRTGLIKAKAGGGAGGAVEEVGGGVTGGEEEVRGQV